jgi:hypothetical protein
MKKKRLKKSAAALVAVYAFCIAVNAAARLSVRFADFFRDRVFPASMNVFARISGVFPFSVGEILIAAAICAALGGIISYIVLMIKKKKERKRISLVYFKVVAYAAGVLFLSVTCHFLVLYRCSTFAASYGMAENAFTADELYAVAVTVASETADASGKITRDDDGRFVLTKEPREEAKTAMRGLGESYPPFKGYYPNAKPMTFSKTVTRLQLLGVYFPFSMEANYNSLMADIDKPSTICHELVHLKGWILEDEANFISFLACIGSENPEFVYSGYASAARYLLNKVAAECPEERFDELVGIIGWDVYGDLYYSREIFREAKKERIGKVKVGEIISETSNAVIDANLIINGVPDGAKSYGRFVDLLLTYYTEGS